MTASGPPDDVDDSAVSSTSLVASPSRERNESNRQRWFTPPPPLALPPAVPLSPPSVDDDTAGVRKRGSGLADGAVCARAGVPGGALLAPWASDGMVLGRDDEASGAGASCIAAGSIERGRGRRRLGTYGGGCGRSSIEGRAVAGDSGSESVVGDIVADDEAFEEVETVVRAVEVERREVVELRRMERQACAKMLTAVRGAVKGASSSGSGSGSTVDLKRMRSHQLGTRCLLLESYTPLSSSSSTVPSPVNERVERACETRDGALARMSSSASSAMDGAMRWPSSGVVGTLRTTLLPVLLSDCGAVVLTRRERIMRGDDCG